MHRVVRRADPSAATEPDVEPVRRPPAAAGLIALQRSAGNAAVAQLVARARTPMLQRSLDGSNAEQVREHAAKLRALARKDPRIDQQLWASEDFVSALDTRIERSVQYAIDEFNDVAAARGWLERDASEVADAIRERSVGHEDDHAFRAFHWRYAMPPLAHLQQSGVLQQAMHSGPTPAYGPGPGQADSWLRNPAVGLALFRQLHRSVLGLLRMANRQGQATAGTFIATGPELLRSVGRLSMMISDSDFFPSSDTRAEVPLNWTSDKFLGERQKSGQLAPENLSLIKQNLQKLRTAQQPAHAKVNQNADTDFPYKLDVRTSASHSFVIRNTGAARMDFSEGEAILDRVKEAKRADRAAAPPEEEPEETEPIERPPAAAEPVPAPAAAPAAAEEEEEDLSYENIVRYLNLICGPLLVPDMLQVFSKMSAAGPFFRELAILLVGLEGSQDNMMALHAPMVTDLVGQQQLTFKQALFTGSRSPTLEAMPYYAYASDKNQKGKANTRSAGPMERQAELLTSGRFDEQQLIASRYAEYDLANKQWESAKAEAWRAEIELELARLKGMADQEKAAKPAVTYKNEDLRKMAEGKEHRALESKAKTNLAGGKADWSAEYDRITPKPKQPAGAPVKDPRAAGYETFRDVFMAKQFELQRLFLMTFFPQVNELEFETPDELVDLAQRILERYMIYRFWGSGKDAALANREWDRDRGALIKR